MKHPEQAWKPASPHRLPARAPHQQVSMTWRGGEEEAQFNNAEATSVSQMESLLPRGWGGVGLKQHHAPAAPHDGADIAA